MHLKAERQIRAYFEYKQFIVSFTTSIILMLNGFYERKMFFIWKEQMVNKTEHETSLQFITKILKHF